MKKIILSIITILLLVGCSSNNRTINLTQISSIDYDMSIYEDVDKFNHAFKKTSVEELSRIIKEKGTQIFYLGYQSCSNCQRTTKYLNSVALELNVTVYYIDALDPKFDMSQEGKIDELNQMTGTLLIDLYEKVAVMTPTLFVIENGKLGNFKIGGKTEDDEQIETLKQDYKKILEPFIIK